MTIEQFEMSSCALPCLTVCLWALGIANPGELEQHHRRGGCGRTMLCRLRSCIDSFEHGERGVGCRQAQHTAAVCTAGASLVLHHALLPHHIGAVHSHEAHENEQRPAGPARGG